MSDESEKFWLNIPGDYDRKVILLISFNPLSPNSDQRQFSPNNIHRLSSSSMRINQMITKRKIFDLLSILPTNSVRKCIEISLENLFVDIGA